MLGHIRDRDELEQELREQAAALRASASGYDSGDLWEAKRLAVVAYVLLHDSGKNSQSLLGQLGLKGEMISTADLSGNSPLPLADISGNAFTGECTFSPFFDMKREVWHRLPFKKWYKEPIFVDGSLRLTRMNLIHTFRSKAGGAHSDRLIDDDAFRWLQKGSPIHVSAGASVTRDADGNEIETPPELAGLFNIPSGPIPNAHYASMRQIAWEVDRALAALGV